MNQVGTRTIVTVLLALVFLITLAVNTLASEYLLFPVEGLPGDSPCPSDETELARQEGVTRTWYTMVWGGRYGDNRCSLGYADWQERCKGSGGHPGVDIRVPSGTQVRAIGVGVVEYSYDDPSWGGLVVIKHENIPGTTEPAWSIYAHLSRRDVSDGQKILYPGYPIGLSGGDLDDPNHGSSDGPHLHFQIDKGESFSYPYWPGDCETESPDPHLADNTFDPIAFVEAHAPNLALSGITSQSSTLVVSSIVGLSRHAIDGRTDGNYSHGSVNHTNSTANSWWRVDLKDSFRVYRVVLWNRNENSTVINRLSNFNVSLLDDMMQPVFSQNYFTNGGSFPNSFEISLPAETVGRYVQVQLNGTNYLHMAEVQVFGGADFDHKFRKIAFSDNFDTENGCVASLNYMSFANWDVTNGTVDLIGNGYYSHFPSTLYVDLAGSTRDAGTITTKESFSLEPGVYGLQFDIANSASRGANTIVVKLGDQFEESFYLPQTLPPKTVVRTIVVSDATEGRLSFACLGGDNEGVLIDNIYLWLIPEIDFDGNVDGKDLAAFVGTFGSLSSSTEYYADADFDCDRDVDDLDLATFASVFGRTDLSLAD